MELNTTRTDTVLQIRKRYVLEPKKESREGRYNIYSTKVTSGSIIFTGVGPVRAFRVRIMGRI
jgi:hypothetical protein